MNGARWIAAAALLGSAAAFGADVVDFPEADSATVASWIEHARRVTVYEAGPHERGGHARTLRAGAATARLLTKTRFQFLPRDPILPAGAVVVGVQIESGDGVVRRWYWTENHPSQVVGRIWGIANSISEREE